MEYNQDLIKRQGLTEEDINRMIHEAEDHAQEDKNRQALAEAKNKADSLIYATEKTMKDNGDKVDGMTRNRIENAIIDLKDAVKGENPDLINQRRDALTQASHKLAEMMYASAKEAAGQAGGGSEGPGSGKPDDVVDAEFEEVKGDQNKS